MSASRNLEPGLIIVASWIDAQKCSGRPLVYVEHGAGQTYRFTDGRCYAGSEGLSDVVLFLAPGEHVAHRWREAYPQAVVEAVGCPALDRHLRPPQNQDDEDDHEDQDERAGGDEHRPIVALTSHWTCHPAGVLIEEVAPITAAGSRWYQGELVIVRCASGEHLPVTPHHPVLTQRGWIEAQSVRPGDQLIRRASGQGMVTVAPDDRKVVVRVEDVAAALHESSPVLAVQMPTTAVDFHGDPGGSHDQVGVVRTDSRLVSDGFAAVTKPSGENMLGWRNLKGSGLAGLSLSRETLGRWSDTAGRFMGGGHLESSLGFGQSAPLAAGRLGDGPNGTVLLEPPVQGRRRDPSGFGGLTMAEALIVETEGVRDPVLEVGRRRHSGRIYTVSSKSGWYLANGFVVHNCGVCPETYPALPRYEQAIAALNRDPGLRLVGHAHPRGARRTGSMWERLGIPFEVDPDVVLASADLLVADNTSLLPEMAAVGKPIVFLNGPGYRRDVEHHGRFWDWPRGQVSCDKPCELAGAVARALADPSKVRAARGRMVRSVYAYTDGRSSERAVDAIAKVLTD